MEQWVSTIVLGPSWLGTGSSGAADTPREGTIISPPSAAVQEWYREDVARYFGCGRMNLNGHRLKTRWDGEETLDWRVEAVRKW